jgi:HSP20 family protein
MATSRWQVSQPWLNQLNQFQGEMNRLFDRWGGNPLNGFVAFPAVNVWEEGERLVVEAELPGIDFKDLEIYVTGGNQLTLKGERKPHSVEKGAWHRQERSFGRFVRTLTLPYPVDAEKVEARLDNGVLQIALAKHESAKPRKITVKAN